MLQLQFEPINNIARIGYLLVKSNIKAKITNSEILLEGDISDDVLNLLYKEINLTSIKNFMEDEDGKAVFKNLPCKTPNYDLIYSTVKRGELYLCDFGEPYGREQGYQQYAIVVQNDCGNASSPTTIVIACTSRSRKWLPVHYCCTFSSKNIVDFDSSQISNLPNVILSEHITTVDKRRLRKYLGTLTPELMEKIDEKINISLDLKTNLEKAYIAQELPMEQKDINNNQIKLLSYVNIDNLLEIAHSSATDETKVKKSLELFGFDLNQNGVQFLFKAITISPKQDYFNLETLSKIVSLEENIDEREIKRLISARVKERFNLKKASAIDFIRLINSILFK